MNPVFLAIAAGLVGTASGAWSQSALPEPPLVSGPELARLVQQLKGGGHVIFLRHLATRHDQEDQQPVDLGDCATQRNLSNEGLAQGKAIGKAFKQARIPIGTLVSSLFCRTRETARLVFGRAPATDADLFFAVALTDAGKKQKGAALRKLMAQVPAKGSNSAIVSHSVNLQEAVGWWPKPEGVAYVVRPDGRGGFEGVARIAPDAWAGAIR